jgi:hypothetical protein
VSLPDLPEGLHWRITRDHAAKKLTASIWRDHGHPNLEPLLWREVCITQVDGEAEVIRLVEANAQALLLEVNREIYLDNVIAKNWPQP